MANSNKLSLGRVLIQIALAVLFIFDGLFLLGFKGSFFSGADAGDVRAAVYKIVGGGDIASIITIALGIIILLCGVFLVIRFFIPTGKVDNVLCIIVCVIWIVQAVLVDVLPVSLDHAWWWVNIARDLLVIGGLLSLHD